ncbi:hypothetical protein F4778DRAFT_199946 [Xylariomycetidae sp. FL2044]|nr:hypothetical protein F4778DRAFT_199946 [Xylariomycetidae sp. FL2044]
MSLFGSRAGPTAGGVSGPPAPKKMIDFSIGTKDKRPYSERVNPLIDPTHPDFIEMEKYFLAKLRDPKLNIDTILKSAFTDHEIALFTPASTPAMLAEWQADDTTRYHNILQTTFKGHVPSLQLKMAFLWFGLPVEPMRPGGYQMPWNSKTRLDFGDDKITHETEPIQFLDDWADRAHAQPGQWARKPEIFRNPPTQTFSTSLNLRGGGSDEMEVDDEEDEEEEVTGTGLPTLGVAGFEGLRVIDYTYHGFVRAVDTLLGMKYQYDYEICVEDWYDHPNAPVARATGKIYHTVGGPPTGDAIEGLLKTVMAREDVREVFVHYSKEEHPTRASPNAVEDQDVIAAQERGRPDTAYMKVPRNMSRGEIWHDLTWDYRKAIKALFPKHDHRLLAYSGDDSLTTYGAFDPDQSVWSLVADQHAQYLSGVRKMLPKVSFRVNPIPTNQVPIVFPGVYDAPVDFSGRHKSATDAPYCIHQDDLRITGKKTDEDGFKRFLAMCWRIYPELEGFVDKDFCHFSVWVTGDNFATLQDRGKHLLPRLGAQGLSEWRDIMSTWQDIGINRFLTGQSIVVRPTFYSHVVYVAGDRDRYTEAVFDDKMTLSEFKRILKDELKMTFTIDEKNDEWVITIRDDAFPRGRTPFQIHSRTNDADWVWIVRNIMGPYLSISIVRNERSPATDHCHRCSQTAGVPRAHEYSISEFKQHHRRFPTGYAVAGPFILG